MSYGQDLVNDAGDLLEGTWEYAGKEYQLKVRNIGYADMKRIQQYATLSQSVESVGDEVSDDELDALKSQAENLEDFSWETGDVQMDWIASIITEKLAKPEVDIEETSAPKLSALLEGMMETWQESEGVASAKEEMPLEEGN